MNTIQSFILSYKTLNNTKIIYSDVFERAGYIGVEAYDIQYWSEIHKWCEKMIGVEHYSWTGHIFWFENEKHALMFKLCWG